MDKPNAFGVAGHKDSDQIDGDVGGASASKALDRDAVRRASMRASRSAMRYRTAREPTRMNGTDAPAQRSRSRKDGGHVCIRYVDRMGARTSASLEVVPTKIPPFQRVIKVLPIASNSLQGQKREFVISRSVVRVHSPAP